MSRESRRNVLKKLAISAPAAWSTPFVASVVLPAHAQSSPCSPRLSCSTDDPVSVTDPTDSGLSNSGTNWGWNWVFSDGFQNTYEALISGLQAQACPGTDVTISIADNSSPGNVTVDGGETVTADASGVASFTERVRLSFTPSLVSDPNAIQFTLRFAADDGSGPCDIAFCFTEYEPGGCEGDVGIGP